MVDKTEKKPTPVLKVPSNSPENGGTSAKVKRVSFSGIESDLETISEDGEDNSEEEEKKQKEFLKSGPITRELSQEEKDLIENLERANLALVADTKSISGSDLQPDTSPEDSPERTLPVEKAPY